jgi:hypothetical protein
MNLSQGLHPSLGWIIWNVPNFVNGKIRGSVKILRDGAENAWFIRSFVGGRSHTFVSRSPEISPLTFGTI